MKKRKRGRPVGGKHSEPIRAYWREIQRNYRAKQVAATVTGKRKRGG